MSARQSPMHTASCGLDVAAEFKWLPEISVSNRLNGNTLWFKLAVSLGANQEDPLQAM